MDAYENFQVPDYLCCKITLDIFRDPVIAPSGLTYERKVLLDHLEKVAFDNINYACSNLQMFPHNLICTFMLISNFMIM